MDGCDNYTRVNTSAASFTLRQEGGGVWGVLNPPYIGVCGSAGLSERGSSRPTRALHIMEKSGSRT